MREYVIKRVENANFSIGDSGWKAANKGYIDQYPWDGKKRPETAFSILYDENGMGVLFESDEVGLILKAQGMNDVNIWCDSCVEFFFNPYPEENDKYINIELSATGYMLIGYGKDRFDRVAFEGDFTQLDIETKIDDDGWKAKFYIPFKFINGYERVSKNMSANLQKCSGSAEVFHTGSWNLIESKEPDFHLSQYFGRLKLE